MLLELQATKQDQMLELKESEETDRTHVFTLE